MTAARPIPRLPSSREDCTWAGFGEKAVGVERGVAVRGMAVTVGVAVSAGRVTAGPPLIGGSAPLEGGLAPR